VNETMSYKTRQEIETEAAHRAREQIDSFIELVQITSGNEQQRTQLESTQRFRAWARVELGYTDEQGKTALEKERADMLQNLYVKNLQHLIDLDEHAKAVSDRSWQLVQENFVPMRIPDNKRLSWKAFGEPSSTF